VGGVAPLVNNGIAGWTGTDHLYIYIYFFYSKIAPFNTTPTLDIITSIWWIGVEFSTIAAKVD
jgi:hypothetical protein